MKISISPKNLPSLALKLRSNPEILLKLLEGLENFLFKNSLLYKVWEFFIPIQFEIKGIVCFDFLLISSNLTPRIWFSKIEFNGLLMNSKR